MADLKQCNCAQFENADPADEIHKDREIREHYIKHGPIQPRNNFMKKDGRCFRPEWYQEFPWLEYSHSRQAAFCFYCRHFAKHNASTTSGGTVDIAFIKKGFDNWKKALEKQRGCKVTDLIK